ncbi:MAG TPA: hypothetical protein VMB79_02315 [Jatrophihabitans sp.]|nr:hypothetical protein [Jatrophihabitans sp.]
MTDSDPPGEPAGEATVLDRLIAWALRQGDADADRITAYFESRAAARTGPRWAATYRREELPFRGRGKDKACSATLRRLRAHHGCASQRPAGTGRPPTLPRLPG